MTGPEQVLIEDWCQQFPSHSIGDARASAPTARSTSSGGDGASFNFADYGQDGRPVNPCGDPPARVGGDPDAADRRGRRAAQPRTCGPSGDPAGARRRDPPRRPDTRAPALPDNPLVAQLRRQRAADHRLRLPQPVPVHDPARDERALGRRRRLERLGGDRPDLGPGRRRRRRTSAGRATRAPGRQSGYDGAEPEHLRDALRRRHGAVTGPYYTYQHSEPGRRRARPARPGSSSITGIAFYHGRQLSRRRTTARSSSPTTRATASG